MLSMVSDRDSRFTKEFWRKLWALHHTTLKMTPAYSPQADGQTERMNRLLQEIMRSNVQADQLNWLELLDGTMMAINNSPVSATQKSPFEMETGLAMRIPLDTQSLMDQTYQNRGHGRLVRDTMEYDDDGVLLHKAPYPGVYEVDHQEIYQFDHPERMRAIHQLAREQMIRAKIRMAEAENKNRPIQEFKTGQYVMLSLASAVTTKAPRDADLSAEQPAPSGAVRASPERCPAASACSVVALRPVTGCGYMKR